MLTCYFKSTLGDQKQKLGHRTPEVKMMSDGVKWGRLFCESASPSLELRAVSLCL